MKEEQNGRVLQYSAVQELTIVDIKDSFNSQPEEEVQRHTGSEEEYLSLIRYLIKKKDISCLKSHLAAWPKTYCTPRALELQAQALAVTGDIHTAELVLNQLINKQALNTEGWGLLLKLNLRANRNPGMALAKALSLFPLDPYILSLSVLYHLRNRQPAKARRASFLERIQYSLGKPWSSREQSDANLLAAIELTGRSDLILRHHRTVEETLRASDSLNANLLLQMASQEDPLYGQAAERFAERFLSSYSESHVVARAKEKKRLRVGLISPDFYYHPVGRFIFMLLKSGLCERGETYLIDTGSNAMTCTKDICPKDRYHAIEHLPAKDQLGFIRSLELDIVIDLAGWTGKNNGWLVSQRLAPVQINYLGYFASSGLKTVDVWLGDSAIFPEIMQEWHSEKIVRLKRPFLAWNPSEELPEGRINVPPAPLGQIVFGSFNNARKLSKRTLVLWGRILSAIPDSQLVLKAYGSDDPGLVRLMESRMFGYGISPSQVRWVPTCPAAEDHLRQYGLIDVALDPFPNGGCTTTCEALWMGVPVISLCGTHYVSRMSTAVLRGANLGEWVAESEEQYFELAMRTHAQLATIRSNRCALRQHVRESPLGDVEDLANHLWQCFEDLAASKFKGVA